MSDHARDHVHDHVSDHVHDHVSDHVRDLTSALFRTLYETSMTHIVEIRTSQVNAFKVLVDTIHSLVVDVCIEFDAAGMRILTVDSKMTVLINVKLHAEKFDFYRYDGATAGSCFSIGVDSPNLNKIMKTVNSKDALTLFVDDKQHLNIKLQNEQQTTTYRMDLMEYNQKILPLNSETFSHHFDFDSVRIQKTLRDLNGFADTVLIKAVGKRRFSLQCKGSFCSILSEVRDTDGDGGDDDAANEDDDTDVVSGTFDLKKLLLFTKCTNLCNFVEIRFKNNYPIIFNYSVANMGEIMLCLEPTAAAAAAA